METPSDLSSKWWYRLVKVIYIISFVIFFWIPSFVIFSNMKPSLNEYLSSYKVMCHNGRVLSSEYPGIDLNWTQTDFASAAKANGVRVACAQELNEDLSTFYSKHGLKVGDIITAEQFAELSQSVPPFKNYTIVTSERVYSGSWFSTIITTLIALVVSLLFFALIRAIFFYVADNRPFWKTLIFKQ